MLFHIPRTKASTRVYSLQKLLHAYVGQQGFGGSEAKTLDNLLSRDTLSNEGYCKQHLPLILKSKSKAWMKRDILEERNISEFGPEVKCYYTANNSRAESAVNALRCLWSSTELQNPTEV
jgi:hypothetical protein